MTSWVRMINSSVFQITMPLHRRFISGLRDVGDLAISLKIQSVFCHKKIGMVLLRVGFWFKSDLVDNSKVIKFENNLKKVKKNSCHIWQIGKVQRRSEYLKSGFIWVPDFWVSIFQRKNVMWLVRPFVNWTFLGHYSGGYLRRRARERGRPDGRLHVAHLARRRRGQPRRTRRDPHINFRNKL